ncbi:hypothetical protein PENTCL1PPCAC_29482, partial [Pristionchus entomophagus]
KLAVAFHLSSSKLSPTISDYGTFRGTPSHTKMNSSLLSLVLISLLMALVRPTSASVASFDGVERIARVTRAQCARVCGVKMTLECCQCIGCHQGMRFGKRSSGPLFAPIDEMEDLSLY